MENVQILYEDQDVIVVVKPAGMASQPERAATMDMVSYLKNYLVREKKVKGVPYIGVVHRLDRPVGGVMVYAKTSQAAGNLSGQVQRHEVVKEYRAVLTGILPDKQGSLEDYLVRDGKTNTSTVCDQHTQGAKLAKLSYQVLRTKYEEGQQYSLVNVQLETGRHHQIRVQMVHAGAGLWGDTKYNPLFSTKTGWYDLALYSWKLAFKHPRTKKNMVFEEKAGHQISQHFDI